MTSVEVSICCPLPEDPVAVSRNSAKGNRVALKYCPILINRS